MAISAALTYRTRGIAFAGVLVVCTPMAMYFGGSINPNSLEIFAAPAMVAPTTVFLREPDSGLGHVMLRRAMIATALLGVCRLLSPVWVAVFFLAFAALASRRAWRALFAKRVLPWLGMAVVANAYAAWRILHANQTQFQLAPQFASSFQERFALSKEFIDDRLAAAQEAHSVDDGQLSRSSSSSPRHSQ